MGVEIPITASTSVTDYLASKGIHTYRAKHPEVVAACWWCNENKPNKRKLYINTETWQFYCQVCMESGGRKTLLTYFGDQDRDEMKFAPGTDPALRRKVLNEAVSLGQDMLYSNLPVLEYLTHVRGLSPQTIVDAKIGYAPSSWGLGRMLLKTNERVDVIHAGLLTDESQEFFSGHILIPYIEYGQCVQLRGKLYVPGKVNGKYVTPGGDQARLYGSDDLLGAREVIVVEGEFDKLALRQALLQSEDARLRAMAVVGLAGAGSFPIGFESKLAQCARIYAGFDPDEAGDLAYERLKTLPGALGKTRQLKLPRELPKADWSDYLGPETESNSVHFGHTWRDVRDLVEVADAAGRRLFTIRDAQRQMRHLDQTIGHIPLGFPEIDMNIVGIKPGQLCVPLARTGVGKTSFLASVVYNTRDRWQMVASLELTAAEFYNRMRLVALFHNPLLTEDELADLYSRVRIYEGTLSPGGLTQLMEEFNEETGEDPHMVHVDYLGYASKRFPGSNQYERTTNAVMTIKEELKAAKVGGVAPHQAGRQAANGVPVRAEDARDSGAIEDTADIMLSLFQPASSDPRTMDPGLVTSEILKNRNGRKGVTSNLAFGMAHMVLVQYRTPEAMLVSDENRLIMSGERPAMVYEMRRRNALHRAIQQPSLLGQ